MRELLKIQEGMDFCLDQRDKELRQLRSQSQADGAQLAVLSLQMQELISSVESRAEVVGKGLEEINGRFNCHRGEIDRLKIQKKDAKQETEKLKGFIVGAGHQAQVFKNRLNRMEENVCRCGQTPSEIGEEFISSEDKGRTELFYASAHEKEYVAPPIKKPVSWVSGFAIHLRIGLSEVKGDAFLGALGVDWMEDCPVVEMEGDMEVVDTEFECRD